MLAFLCFSSDHPAKACDAKEQVNNLREPSLPRLEEGS